MVFPRLWFFSDEVAARILVYSNGNGNCEVICDDNNSSFEDVDDLDTEEKIMNKFLDVINKLRINKS